MLIAGVSTLIFNGNPLLRFDGYYIFADWLEIPNLGARSNRYLGYLIQRYLFGAREASSPAAPGERAWLAFYAVASFGYRMFVMVAIVMFVVTKFFFIGVLIGIWAGILMFVLPLTKSAAFLISSPRLREHRRRALAVTALVLGVVGGGGGAFFSRQHPTVPWQKVSSGFPTTRRCSQAQTDLSPMCWWHQTNGSAKAPR